MSGIIKKCGQIWLPLKLYQKKKEKNQDQMELIYLNLKLNFKHDLSWQIPYLGTYHNHQMWLSNHMP